MDIDSETGSTGSVELDEEGENVVVRKITKQEEKATNAMKAVQKNRLKQIMSKQNRDMEASGKHSLQSRLNFLKQKSEVFSRFMDPVVDGPKKKGRKPKNAAGRGGGKRKTEEEEDAELMKADSQGHRATRLTVQPACIVGGTMRWYQIEGLNWMVNLYEQGINGILADEMGLGKSKIFF